jgi:DNA-binding LacI/PurR family transcriptional regulator
MSQNVSPKKFNAIFAMATGQGISKAARSAGVSRKTVSRWMADPEFRKNLTDMRATVEQTAISEATRQLSGLVLQSVEELGSMLSTVNLPTSDKIRVIRTVLVAYPKFYETVEADKKLNQILEILNGRKN